MREASFLFWVLISQKLPSLNRDGFKGFIVADTHKFHSGYFSTLKRLCQYTNQFYSERELYFGFGNKLGFS